ncbi:MAG TPA: serine/threonine-protein kinase, partial [Pirellulales bacterium]|nr:serine/threonine-protein kinase [Pirellulales bacterium]
MPSSDCPSSAELTDYTLGKLPPSCWEQVAEHVDDCGRCESVLSDLDRVADPVVGVLRSGPASGTTEVAAEYAPPKYVAAYEILGELGRGGMGVVYQARHTKLGRTVALKMLLAGSFADRSHLTRFRVEAEAVARLQHPNIVQVFDLGEQNRLPFLVMEYVPGGTLAQRLNGEPLPPHVAAEVVTALADAVHYAHQRGVLHRDLKPGNILLAAGTRESSPDERRTMSFVPKIADFGVARRLDENGGETQTGMVLGTVNYMAPEMAAGRHREAGTLADVYALGAILYECLTGRPPFKGTTLLATLQQVEQQEPVAPSRWRPELPRDLETICLTCLA